jgi:pimeloyl-ACP methyl ester carboxylesterase
LSGKPTDEIYDTKTQAADLHTILRTVEVEKAVHVGHSFGGPIALQYYFDHPNEVAGLIFIGSYSAGRQLAITEEQVLSLYDTIQGRHAVFETFITHEKFAKFNPCAAEIEATLQREACKPPSMPVRQLVGAFSDSTLPIACSAAGACPRCMWRCR